MRQRNRRKPRLVPLRQNGIFQGVDLLKERKSAIQPVGIFGVGQSEARRGRDKPFRKWHSGLVSACARYVELVHFAGIS